jgi:hypothetical protein
MIEPGIEEKVSKKSGVVCWPIIPPAHLIYKVSRAR